MSKPLLTRSQDQWLILGITLTILISAAGMQADVLVGLVTDGSSRQLEALTALIKQEAHALTEGEHELDFADRVSLSASWTMEGARAALQSLYDDPEVDVILAIGGLSATAAALGDAPPKPVIAPFAIDPEVQGFPELDGASGVHNLCYVAIPSPIDRDLSYLYQIAPFKKVAILVPAPILEAISEETQAPIRSVEDLGVETLLIGARGEVDQIMSALPADVDAVYVAPLLQLDSSEMDDLVAQLIERRLPSFSLVGHADVRQGLLAGVRSEAFFSRLARRTALNLQRVVLGEDAGSIPVAFKDEIRLMINMRTARAIGRTPSWSVMGEAELLHADDLRGDELTLAEAVSRARGANLALISSSFELEAASQRVPEARAELLPGLEASLTGTRIDKDRAAASLGAQAERSASAALTMTQLIYSDQALANLEIQVSSHSNAQAQHEALRLEVTRDAAVSYLEVLRADTLRSIQQSNLQLSRSNLELARSRRRIGASGLSEVLRWESRIAADRQAVVEAGQLGRVAEVALNRALNEDLGQRWSLAEITFDDPTFLHSDPRFERYVDNPISYAAFVELMVIEGLRDSPTLAAFDHAIKAARRRHDAARRALFAPTVALSGQLSHQLGESDAGDDQLPGPVLDSPTSDDTDWSLALSVSLPVDVGGGSTARREQTLAELRGLEADRAAAAEAVEQGVRSSLHLLGSAYSNIGLSRDAADAAGRSLELVTDAYARGAVSITELLDAQNAALTAELTAATAVYDYLIRLMELQYAISSFDLDRTAAQREDFFVRLEQHFSIHGVRLD